MPRPTSQRKPIPLARIIRDPRDATRDYFMVASRAEALFSEGKLLWDATNETFATRFGERV